MLTVDVGNSSVGVGRTRAGEFEVARFSEPEDAAGRVVSWLMEDGAWPSQVPDGSHGGAAPSARSEIVPLPLAVAAAVSVARPRLQRLQDALVRAGASPLVVLRDACLPLADVRLATSAGADRIANATAVLPGPGIAVDAGTALTVDLVDAAGTYLGGYIAPGPAAALLGLARSTAALPQLPGRPVPIEAGLQTDDAIAAGGWGLVVGGCDRLVSQARARLGETTRVVVTGAWGRDWIEHSTLRDLEWDAHLVHRGIRAWAERVLDAGR